MEEQKVCSGCQREQPVSAFYRAAGGRLRARCKACMADAQRAYKSKPDVAAHYRELHRKYEESDRYREIRAAYRTTEAAKAAGRRYRQTDAGKQSLKARRQRHDQEHPEKRRARKAVQHAVKTTAGIFRRDECEACGARGVPIHAHHPHGYDVANRLNVHWLCQTCHAAAHHPTPRSVDP